MTTAPFLRFEIQAEDAMNYYLSVFQNGKAKAVFTKSTSFFVSCETQADIDRLWTTLVGNGGEPSRSGWLKDKYGLSWQIIPASLGRLLSGGGEAARAGRVLNAMLQMDKLDVARLQRAYDGA